jgi:TRAP-type C4-dicarboxylate transport system permease large subunit
MLALMVVAWLVAIRRGYPRERFPGWAVLLRLLAGSLPGLMLIVIIFAGVRSGVFTATESACVAVLYALLVTRWCTGGSVGRASRRRSAGPRAPPAW